MAQRKIQAQKGAKKFLKIQTPLTSSKNPAPFQIGSILTVKIHALGSDNLGLSELKNGYTIVVPNVSLSDEVRVSIEAIFSDKPKYAIAKVLETIQKAQPKELNVRAGEIMDVTITKDGPKGSGIVQLSNNFSIIIPKTKVGDQIKIQVTRVKEDYAFAKVLTTSSFVNKSQSIQSKQQESTFDTNVTNFSLKKGNKYHLVLPKKAKFYKDYLIVKFNGSIVFIKMALGAQLGNTVRIETMKVGPKYAVAKILKVSPLNKFEKLTQTKNCVQKMIQTGMHFGEKAIRCNANMRKYIWFKKKGLNQKQVLPLLKKDSYYINVLKTRRCLTKALKQLAKYAAKGKTFLFVGTQKSASALIARTAMFTKTSFFVNTRWLGGMLTNWKTILKSIAQIQPILKEKQKIIQTILEKRQKIQQKFYKKVNLLRKRSQKFMLKGNQLIQKIQQNRNHFIEKSQKLLQKRNQIVQKNQFLVQKYIELKMKKKEGIQKSHQLLQQGRALTYQKQSLIEKYKNTQTKIQEFKQLFIIGQELLKIQQSAKKEGQEVLAISYGKVYPFLNEMSEPNQNVWAVPMPPADILNSMIQCMKIKSLNIETSTSNRSKAEEKVNTIVFSQFLKKFTAFLPFIQISIENYIQRAQNLQALLKATQQNIVTVNEKLEEYNLFSTKIEKQLQLIQTKLLSQQKTLKTLRKKIKVLAAEQRLLKFFPSLRYLTTPKEKMAQTVQTLMKKFVDPKLTVPMEQIYDDKFQFTSKKIAAVRKQKWQRLEKYFGGIAKMAKMNKKQISNNIAVIIGQQEEMNAVRECQKLGIQMFTVVDTNCNPRLSNHIIPANDDSRNSVKFILEEVLTHIRLAQKLRQKIGKRKTLRFKPSR
jgi:small subunit ribosomal protein S2